MIKHIEFKCDNADIDAFKNRLIYGLTIKAFNVEEEEIMDSLNFEDVMNYFGVDKVSQWVDENK